MALDTLDQQQKPLTIDTINKKDFLIFQETDEAVLKQHIERVKIETELMGIMLTYEAIPELTQEAWSEMTQKVVFEHLLTVPPDCFHTPLLDFIAQEALPASFPLKKGYLPVAQGAAMKCFLFYCIQHECLTIQRTFGKAVLAYAKKTRHFTDEELALLTLQFYVTHLYRYSYQTGALQLDPTEDNLSVIVRNYPMFEAHLLTSYQHYKKTPAQMKRKEDKRVVNGVVFLPPKYCSNCQTPALPGAKHCSRCASLLIRAVLDEKLLDRVKQRAEALYLLSDQKRWIHLSACGYCPTCGEQAYTTLEKYSEYCEVCSAALIPSHLNQRDKNIMYYCSSGIFANAAHLDAPHAFCPSCSCPFFPHQQAYCIQCGYKLPLEDEENVVEGYIEEKTQSRQPLLPVAKDKQLLRTTFGMSEHPTQSLPCLASLPLLSGGDDDNCPWCQASGRQLYNNNRKLFCELCEGTGTKPDLPYVVYC